MNLNDIEYGFIFGLLLCAFALLGLFVMYLLAVIAADKIKRMRLENRLESETGWRAEDIDKYEKASAALRRYSQAVDANFRADGNVPRGFERCPNPSMITPTIEVSK